MHGKHIIHTLTDFKIYRMFNMLSMWIVERRKIGRLRIEIITASEIPNVRLNYEIRRNMSNTVRHIERNIFKALENVPSNEILHDENVLKFEIEKNELDSSCPNKYKPTFMYEFTESNRSINE